MHIILMLALVILGLSLMEFSSVLGGLILLGGFSCFLMGSARWREEQEGMFFAIGLLGAAAILGVNFIRWLFSF